MSLISAKAEIERLLDDFCGDKGYHEPDTNHFVYDTEAAQRYAEGLEDALEIIEKHLGLEAASDEEC